MTPRYPWLVVFVLLLGLASAGAARGQSKEAAEQKSAQGRLLYDQEKFDLALASFKAAFALHPSSRYLFNSAKACIRLDDSEGAIYYYQQYLVLETVAADRDTVRAEIEELRSGLLAGGRVEVRLHVEPAGATVSAPHNHPSEVGSAPASLFLAPGSYAVCFQSAGLLEQTVTVEVTATSPPLVTVEVALEKPTLGNLDGSGAVVKPDPAPFPWQWVMLGVGGAGLVAAGTGSYLWYDGWAGMGEANDSGGLNYTSNYRTARDRYLAGQWVTAAGAAVVVGGVLGYYLWPRAAGAAAPSVSLLPSDDGVVLGFGAWF